MNRQGSSILFAASAARTAATILVFVLLNASFHIVSARAAWLSDGNPISRATRNQKTTRVVSDNNFGAVIVWEDYRAGSSSDIYAQRVSAGGDTLWTCDGVPVCTASDNQEGPKLASDGAGGAIIAWQDGRSGVGYDIYAGRVDSNGDVQWPANGVLLCGVADNQEYPEVSPDGAGGAIIVWQDFRSGTTYDVYAQRVDQYGNTKWTVNGVAICAAAGHQYYPRIVQDGSGGAIIAWEDWRNGIDSDIYAQRVDPDGNVLWTLNGIPVCTATDHQFEQGIVPDDDGGAIVAWEAYNGGEDDIYVQRLDANGNPLWTANGVAVCTAANAQVGPELVLSGNAGAIVTWEDWRIEDDVYAQRISSNGNIMWAVNGVAVCNAPNGQNSVQIASDGARGAVITWQDYSSVTQTDIYAQRIDSSGVVKWAPNGIAVCVASGFQYYPSMVYDGIGGEIFAWEDYRGGSGSDVYAVKLNQDGAITGTERPAVSARKASLEQNVPNPFNPLTSVMFTVESPGRVLLQVYDVAGLSVCTLLNNWREPGTYTQNWDGRTDDGREVPSGVYFCSIKTGNFAAARKMVLLK